MAVATLIVAGGVSIGVGLSFAAVFRAVARRSTSSAGKMALRAYGLWWASLSFYLVVHGVLTVMAAYGVLEETLHFAVRVVMVPVLCTAVWGITTYLLYLYTGDARVFPVAGVFYSIICFAFYWATFTASRNIVMEPWLVTIDDSSPLYRVVYLVIGLPPIMAAVAYLGLLRKASDRPQRYRIVLVSGSILAYVGSGLVARLSANDVAIFITLVLFGALAATASLMAFYPPLGVQAWLTAPPVAAADRAQQRQRRLLELV